MSILERLQQATTAKASKDQERQRALAELFAPVRDMIAELHSAEIYFPGNAESRKVRLHAAPPDATSYSVQVKADRTLSLTAQLGSEDGAKLDAPHIRLVLSNGKSGRKASAPLKEETYQEDFLDDLENDLAELVAEYRTP